MTPQLEGILKETMEKYGAEFRTELPLRTYHRLRKEFTGLYKFLRNDGYDMAEYEHLYNRLIHNWAGEIL